MSEFSDGFNRTLGTISDFKFARAREKYMEDQNRREDAQLTMNAELHDKQLAQADLDADLTRLKMFSEKVSMVNNTRLTNAQTTQLASIAQHNNALTTKVKQETKFAAQNQPGLLEQQRLTNEGLRITNRGSQIENDTNFQKFLVEKENAGAVEAGLLRNVFTNPETGEFDTSLSSPKQLTEAAQMLNLRPEMKARMGIKPDHVVTMISDDKGNSLLVAIDPDGQKQPVRDPETGEVAQFKPGEGAQELSMLMRSFLNGYGAGDNMDGTRRTAISQFSANASPDGKPDEGNVTAAVAGLNGGLFKANKAPEVGAYGTPPGIAAGLQTKAAEAEKAAAKAYPEFIKGTKNEVKSIFTNYVSSFADKFDKANASNQVRQMEDQVNQLLTGDYGFDPLIQGVLKSNNSRDPEAAKGYITSTINQAIEAMRGNPEILPDIGRALRSQALKIPIKRGMELLQLAEDPSQGLVAEGQPIDPNTGKELAALWNQMGTKATPDQVLAEFKARRAGMKTGPVERTLGTLGNVVRDAARDGAAGLAKWLNR